MIGTVKDFLTFPWKDHKSVIKEKIELAMQRMGYLRSISPASRGPVIGDGIDKTDYAEYLKDDWFIPLISVKEKEDKLTINIKVTFGKACSLRWFSC